MDIKELRIDKGVKQITLVRLFGIPLRTLQHWEYGDRSTSTYNIDRIMACLEYLNKDRQIFAGYIREDNSFAVALDKMEALARATEEWNSLSDKNGKRIVAGVFALDGGTYTGIMWEVYAVFE